MPNARRRNLVHLWHVGIGFMLGMLIYFLSPFHTRWVAKANAVSGEIWALDIPYVHCLREMTVGSYLPIPHTELYKKSVFYNGANLWNQLPPNIRPQENLESFKALLYKHIL